MGVVKLWFLKGDYLLNQKESTFFFVFALGFTVFQEYFYHFELRQYGRWTNWGTWGQQPDHPQAEKLSLPYMFSAQLKPWTVMDLEIKSQPS